MSNSFLIMLNHYRSDTKPLQTKEKKDRMKLKVQHDPLPSGFREVRIEKRSEEKLGMVIKGGLQGQPGNPLDPADE